MSKLNFIRAAVLSLGMLGASVAMASEASFSCPDLSAAEQVGSCPSKKN